MFQHPTCAWAWPSETTSDPHQVDRRAKIACPCQWEQPGSHFSKHSLADKEQSQQQFHGVSYLQSTMPETLTNLSSKAASSTPSKGNYEGDKNPQRTTSCGCTKKNWQQIPSSTHVHKHRHIHTHTLQFPGAIIDATRWLWGTTFDFSYLSTLIPTWEENTVPGMILLGLVANYFGTGESESGWNTKKQSSINAAFQWQNQLCST